MPVVGPMYLNWIVGPCILISGYLDPLCQESCATHLHHSQKIALTNRYPWLLYYMDAHNKDLTPNLSIQPYSAFPKRTMRASSRERAVRDGQIDLAMRMQWQGSDPMFPRSLLRAAEGLVSN